MTGPPQDGMREASKTNSPLAVTYCPTPLQVQYRRRCNVSLPCSGWERVGPSRSNHQGTNKYSRLAARLGRTAHLTSEWSRGADSNRRPLGYEPNELPLLHPAEEAYPTLRHDVHHRPAAPGSSSEPDSAFTCMQPDLNVGQASRTISTA